MGVNESDLVITKSESMKKEIIEIHEIPQCKIVVVPPTEKDWIKEIIKSYCKVIPNERE